MINEWLPERIVATAAGDIVVTSKLCMLAYLISETPNVVVSLKDGSKQVYAGLTGIDEDDHGDAPILLLNGITLNFSAAGAATIKYMYGRG